MGDVLDRLLVVWTGREVPDWEGNFVGIGRVAPGLGGVPRPSPWDAVVSASAPQLRGDEVRFVVDEDEQVEVDERESPEALEPLVSALVEELDPPFCAVGVREEGDVWAAAANKAQIVTLAAGQGEVIEVSRIGEALTTRVDGADCADRFPELEALIDQEGRDASVIAHRFLGLTWIAEVFPL